MDIFAKRKQDILSKQDKSSKQSLDKRIKDLCEKINKKENYYTTSSCSGRVILIIDSDKKEHGLFVKIYHDLLSFENFKRDLNKIISTPSPHPNLHPLNTRKFNDLQPASFSCQLKDKLGNKKFLTRKIMQNASVCTISPQKQECRYELDLKQLYSEQKRSEISFKQEPCALHVACRTLKDSQKFLDKAKFAGWKKSGIIASNKRFIVECFSTEKLEFPIVNKSKILVDDNFLKLIVKKSNENLKRSWRAISRLEKEIENNEIKKECEVRLGVGRLRN